MGTKLATDSTCDISPVKANPIPMATRAVTMGITAASTEPNSTTSTIRAKITPRKVLSEELDGSAFSMAWPLSSTCRLALRADSAVSMSLTTSALLRSWPRAFQSTVAKAMVPALLICALPAAL
jgi:hypothetical protein